MVKGSRFGDLLPVSFFLFSCFPFCSSSPMSSSIARGVLVSHPLCLDPFPFLLFFLPYERRLLGSFTLCLDHFPFLLFFLAYLRIKLLVFTLCD